jgi:pectate lyase
MEVAMRGKFLVGAAALSVGVAGCADMPTGIATVPLERSASVSYPWNPETPLPAFPGAEGFGAYTAHGRGGTVIKVTSLSDENVRGTLRWALTSSLNSGPRIIVFDVGGEIHLNSPVNVRNGNVYIAGQTAPGDGITLTGSQLSIQTSNVVVRHIRSRPGDAGGTAYDGRDGLQIITHSGNRQLRNIILDHVSVSWGVDENASVWPSTAANSRIENVTVQWSIISEALMNSFHSKGPHSMGFLVGEGSRNISFHHNLLAHNNQRNPRIKHDVLNADIVNNVIYNWGEMSAEVGERTDLPPSTINFVRNFWKAGSNSPLPEDRREVRVKPMAIGSGIYFEGNFGPSRPFSGNQAPRQQLPPEHAISDIERRYPNEINRYVSPYRFTFAPITEQRADLAYHLVLARAGASVPARDAIDERVIKSVRDGTGVIIDSQSQVGGWVAQTPATRPAEWDTDGDGMPDWWEIEKGLNPNDPLDANADRNGDGYTNIEEYINSLAG